MVRLYRILVWGARRKFKGANERRKLKDAN